MKPTPTPDDWSDYLGQALPQLGAELAPGLTPGQILRLQEAAGAALPTEVRILLSLALPLGPPHWRDWRTRPDALLTDWREEVLDGLLFDVLHGDFWSDTWGPRPDAPDARVSAARAHASRLPRLFPLYAHRAIALDPAPGHGTADGNPVFSVHQSDVIYYGYDLADWLHREFAVPRPPWASDQPRWIPFWSPLTSPA